MIRWIEQLQRFRWAVALFMVSLTAWAGQPKTLGSTMRWEVWFLKQTLELRRIIHSSRHIGNDETLNHWVFRLKTVRAC